MENKLYYTCPIVAAYMSKYFGVKYFCEDDDEVIDYQEICVYNRNGKWDDPIKAFIHPDSLPIFEPQVMDLVKPKSIYDHDFGTVVDIEGNGLKIFYAKSSEKISRRVSAIIQRNGMSFFMPEVKK